MSRKRHLKPIAPTPVEQLTPSLTIGLKLGLNSQTIDLGEYGICKESRAQDVGSGVR